MEKAAEVQAEEAAEEAPAAEAPISPTEVAVKDSDGELEGEEGV